MIQLLLLGLTKIRPNPPIVNSKRAPSTLSISMSSGSPFDPRACFPPALSLATVCTNHLFDLGIDRDSVHVFHHPLWHVRRRTLKLDIFRSKSSLGGTQGSRGRIWLPVGRILLVQRVCGFVVWKINAPRTKNLAVMGASGNTTVLSLYKIDVASARIISLTLGRPRHRNGHFSLCSIAR